MVKIYRFWITFLFFIFLCLFIIFKFPTVGHTFDVYKHKLIFLNEGRRTPHLFDAVNAYNDLQIPLIRYVDFIDSDSVEKKFIFPMETTGDDLGIYLVIPWLSKTFNIHYKQAYLYFFISMVLLGFLIANIGFHLLINENTKYYFSVLMLSILAFFMFYILDVYVFLFLSVCFLPLLIYLFHYKSNQVVVYFSFLMIFIVLGIYNQFRAYASFGVFLFMFFYIIITCFKQSSFFKPLLFVFMMLMGLGLPYIFKHQIIQLRNKTLIQRGYDSRLFSGFMYSHIFWHGMYLGLGYDKENKYGIKWSDVYGYNTVRDEIKLKNIQNIPKINALSMPQKYEEIMMRKYIYILKEDPIFILKTYFKKLLDTLSKTFIFFHIGFLGVFYKRQKEYIFPFIIMMLFYSIPGVLFWPYYAYLTGLISSFTIIGSLLFVKTRNY